MLSENGLRARVKQDRSCLISAKKRKEQNRGDREAKVHKQYTSLARKSDAAMAFVSRMTRHDQTSHKAHVQTHYSELFVSISIFSSINRQSQKKMTVALPGEPIHQNSNACNEKRSLALLMT